MSFGDRLLNAIDKVTGPARDQTASDDAYSRLARREQAEQSRMTREEHDPETGEQQWWFTITIPSIAGFQGIPVPWLGTNEDDARASFIEWLAQDKFQTIDFVNNGKEMRLTFQGSWVAGFTMDGKKRSRP